MAALAAQRIAAVALAGATTICGASQLALGGAERSLDADDLFRFTLGPAVFRRQWVSAPASTTASDGLGPLYNARSCEQCHMQAGRGQPEQVRAGDRPSALVLRLSVPPRTEAERALISERRANVLPEPTYGVQLQ